MGNELIAVRGAAVAACLAAGFAALTSSAASAETIGFIPGTYELAEGYGETPVDTLTVSVSGGVAYFTLSGSENATFSVDDNVEPSGFIGGNPYFTDAAIRETSWRASEYPYLTFWTTASEGGVTAGTEPGDTGTNHFDLFQSTEGSSQVFTVTVPEPSTWALMTIGLVGLAYAGGLRAKTARGVATA